MPKCKTKLYWAQEIQLESFFHRPTTATQKKSHYMCPIRALQAYVDKTKDLQKSKQLFVSYKTGSQLFAEQLFGQTSTLNVSTTEPISCGRATASLRMSYPRLPMIILECLKSSILLSAYGKFLNHSHRSIDLQVLTLLVAIC